MLEKKYNISVKGKHTFLIVWIQVADTIYKQLTVKINSVWSGFFGVFWYRSIDLQVYLFFCYESKPFCHPNINFNVRLESLKSVSKIGEYPRIFPSFSWGIFVHVTRLDQSRARENIWCIIKTDMHLKKGGPDVFQIYPNAIHFNPLQFCPSMSLHGFPVFCLRSAIGFSRYRDILVNSMPIWSVLKLPKIAWPTPFNLSLFPCIR